MNKRLQDEIVRIVGINPGTKASDYASILGRGRITSLVDGVIHHEDSALLLVSKAMESLERDCRIIHTGYHGKGSASLTWNLQELN